MIDVDAVLPAARTRLLALCRLHANATDDAARAQYLKSIEATALDIGYVFAIDLINMGWTPRESEIITISKRLLAAA